MTFPVVISIGGWTFQPHPVFELLGYATGIALFLRARRLRGDMIDRRLRWSVVAAALIGGAIGSRILDWPNGKTVVGGLIGGLIAVEWIKRRIAVTAATGDLFAIPLAVGIAIGRVGCFLAGLPDHTYGVATTWWTGVDFGDSVRRHPTQLYEVVFLLMLVALLTSARKRLTTPGDQFRLFMVAYLAFRVIVDAIKPDPSLALGLTSIQWACLATLAYYAPTMLRWSRRAMRRAIP